MDDVQAIANLVYSYPETLDTGNFEAMGALFEHAVIHFGGSDHEIRGADGAQALIEQTVQLYEGIPNTKHITTNLMIDIDPDGRATARSYWTALQAVPGFPLQPILAGRWHDRFERINDRWRFTDRLIYVDLVGDASHHVNENSGPEDLATWTSKNRQKYGA